MLNTPIHKTQPRIERFIMLLQKYDFILNYILPGKALFFDALSRAPLKDQIPEISQAKVNF